MKFTCLGSNPAAVALIREIVSSAEHTLQPCCVSGALQEGLVTNQVPVRIASGEEDALHDPATDVVISAMMDPDDCLRIARAAAQSGRHVVVFPPLNCSPAVAFELHLILDESRSAVIPVTGRWFLDALPLSQDRLSELPAGLSRLSLEIPIPPTAAEVEVADSGRYHVMLRQRVETGLDLLTATGLPYAQVTALDARAPGGALLSRLITLNSQTSADTLLPAATVTLRTAQQPTESDFHLQYLTADGTATRSLWNEQRPLLPRIELLCTRQDLCTRWMESFASTLELAEAVDKSLKRRRTVDVHFDTGSERGVFKSQMTAMGCGILTWMLLGLVAYLVVAGLFPLPEPVLHVARILWVLPLVLFLLAQLLLPVARGRSKSRTS